MFPNNINQPSVWENDPRGNYEPTDVEAQFLDVFSQDFAKILADITIQINGFEQLSKTEKINVLNQVVERMQIVKNYFATNHMKGLTIQGLELRNLLIEVMFEKISNFINSKAFELGLFKSTKTVLIPKDELKSLMALKPLDRKVFTPFTVPFEFFSETRTSSGSTVVTDPVKPDLPNGSTIVNNPTKPDVTNTGTKPNEPSPTTPETTGNKKVVDFFRK